MSDNRDALSYDTRKGRHPLSRKKKLLFTGITLLLGYSFAELVLTSLYMQGTLLPIPKSTVVLEQAEQGPVDTTTLFAAACWHNTQAESPLSLPTVWSRRRES